jgi:hypothetical protein
MSSVVEGLAVTGDGEHDRRGVDVLQLPTVEEQEVSEGSSALAFR